MAQDLDLLTDAVASSTASYAELQAAVATLGARLITVTYEHLSDQVQAARLGYGGAAEMYEDGR